MKKITGVLIDVNHGTAEPVTIDKSLDGYYKALDCDTIDIVQLPIGSHSYDIVCDDNGLLKDGAIASAFHEKTTPVLVGNLFIVKYNGRGDLKSLTDAEIAEVMSCTRPIFSTRGDRKRAWIVVDIGG